MSAVEGSTVSLRDLQQAGVLLPRDEWGVHDLHTSVNKPMLIAAFVLGIVAVAMMYLGGGNTITFIGGGLFIGFMAWITHISVRAVDVQAAQFAEEQRLAHRDQDTAESQESTPPAQQ